MIREYKFPVTKFLLRRSYSSAIRASTGLPSRKKSVTFVGLGEHDLIMDTQNLHQSQYGWPSTDPLTLKAINERNRQFWLEQNALREERMADSAIFGIAERGMRSEVARCVAIRAQKTLEQALADADDAKQLFQRDFSRRGGEKDKSNALQQLIVEIARENSDITQNELFQKLRSQEGEGIIFSIDGNCSVLAGDGRKIHFYNHQGLPKKASVDGLKDRLFRAKKIIRANR